MEHHFEELERRIQHLEYRVKLLAEIADFERHPFIFTVLEADLAESQVKDIFDLMDKVSKAIKDHKPMSHNKLEESVYEIVPARRGDYHLAQDIVSTLNDEGKWAEVYRHMKKDGMNI